MENYIRIQSNFFFELGNTPPTGEGFGPLGNTSLERNEKYQVTTTFNNSGNIKAIAVCNSEILIVPQVNSAGTITDKVNLILKPESNSQPCSEFNIKYLVYRGLLKSSFLDANVADTIHQYGVNNKNALLNKIWAKIKGFYYPDPNSTAGLNSDKVKPEDVGYFRDLATIPDNTLIEDFFAQNLNVEFQIPRADQGDWIGDFYGDFGFEIVLSDNSNEGFDFDFKYARAEKCIFDIDPTPSHPSGFNEKRYRENILNFMDPSAFYGMHFTDFGKLYIYPNEPVGSPMQYLSTEADSNAIYDDVVSLFGNKNKIYIDIRSERNRSYNYFSYYSESKNNHNSLKLGLQSGNLNLTEYNTESWPILIIEAPIAPTTFATKYHINLKNLNNKRVFHYLEIGAPYIDLNRFSFSNVDSTEQFPFEISVLWKNCTDGAIKSYVSRYIRLLYLANFSVIPEKNLNYDTMDIYSKVFPSDIFSLNSAKRLKVLEDRYGSSVITIPHDNSWISKFPGRNSSGFFGIVGQTVSTIDKIFRDEDKQIRTKFLFEMEFIEFWSENPSSQFAKTIGPKESTFKIDEYSADKGNSYLLGVSENTWHTKSCNFLYGPRVNLPFINIGKVNAALNFKLGLDESEVNSLIQIANDEGLVDPRIGLVAVNDGQWFLDGEDIYYQQFEVQVVGENMDGFELAVDTEDTPSGTELNTPVIQTPKVYTIDGQIFFSYKYVLDFPENPEILNDEIDEDEDIMKVNLKD